jgi:hypothetical protein
MHGIGVRWGCAVSKMAAAADRAASSLPYPIRKLYRKKRRQWPYLRWLASSEGPHEAAYLKRFTPPRSVLALLRLYHAFSKHPPRCRESDSLFLVPRACVKASVIRHHAKTYGLRTLVETGTWRGDTIAAVADRFERCITIELSTELWREACARFRASPNVTCLHGDSGVVLPQVLAELRAPALFWLDAHASGGPTVDSGKGPILDELRAILSHGERGHVVLIDDARGHALEPIEAAVPAGHRFTVRNDIIRITPDGS